MQIPNWVIFTSIELFAALLILIFVLLFRTRSLNRLISRLQLKVQALVADLKKTKKEMETLRGDMQESSSYEDLLEEQIDYTKEYHQSLDSGQDIVLDLADSDFTSPRHLSALRHAFLVAEKEGTLSSNSKTPNWEVIQTKLSNIVSFIIGGVPKSSPGFSAENAADPEANQDERVNDRGEIVRLRDDSSGASSTSVSSPKSPSGDSTELYELRALAAQQKKMIADLQGKIADAVTEEEKTDLIRNLQQQLEAQQRYMQESEMCINQMDDELQSANQLIADMKRAAASGGSGSEDTEAMRNAIKTLTMENDQLAMQLQSSMEDNRLVKKYSALEQEHKQLKSKYIAVVQQLKQTKN